MAPPKMRLMKVSVAFLALLLVSLLLITGCGGGEKSEAPPEETPPEEAPAKESETSSQASRSVEVIQAFQNAGLEVGEVYPVEEEPGWNNKPIPKTYAEATRFEIPSLGGGVDETGLGGRVFVFGSEEDLTSVRDYYEGLQGAASPYVYVEGNVLMQITNQLPEDQAQRYEAVLSETA